MKKQNNGKNMTMKNWNYIFNRKPHWTDIFSTCAIGKFDYGFTCVRVLRLWAYLLLLIPCAVIELFHCLWDGGLREWRFPARPVTKRSGYTGEAGFDGEYDRMTQVWEIK